MSSEATPLAGRDDGDQAEVVNFLSDPKSYSPEPSGVERITTHAAMVFLAGGHAFKIKRAVTFSYLDFSRLEQRHKICQREFEINSANAPDLYLGVVAITRNADGTLSMGGPGEVVEWAVQMRRFATENILSSMLAQTAPSDRIVRDLAEMVATLHRRATPVNTDDGANRIAEIIEELATAFGELDHLYPAGTTTKFNALCRDEFSKDRLGLKLRSRRGCVRHCHGDLHLGNIVEINGKPVAFDALEFDDRMAITDVLYDLAFLVMDLEARGYRRAANLLLNRYVVVRRQLIDLQGLAMLPLFLALRAAIRSMVALQRGGGKAQSATEAHDYLKRAIAYLTRREPCLVAVGGYSGSGKSTIARELAPFVGGPPGAIHISSDQTRKELAGVPETERIGAAGYSAAKSAAVYECLKTKALRLLRGGNSVVVDATFMRADERKAMEALAVRRHVPFVGLWLSIDRSVAKARVAAREADASDATAEVVDYQFAQSAPAGDWTIINGDGALDQTIERVKQSVEIFLS